MKMEENENKVEIPVADKAVSLDSTGKKNHTAIIALVILALVVAIGFRGYYFYKKMQVSNPVKITTNYIRDLGKSSNKEMEKLNDFMGKNKSSIVSINGNVGDAKFNFKTETDRSKNIFNIFANISGLETDDLYIDGKVDVNGLLVKISKTGNAYKIDQDFKDFFDSLASYSNGFDNKESIKILDYLADSFEETFTKDDFTKSSKEMTLFDKNVKATVYNTKVNDKKMAKLLGNFIDKIASDDDFVNLLLDAVKSVDDSVTITKDELAASLKEAKAEIESDLEGLSFDYTITVYKNDVVGFAIANSEDGISIEYKEYKDQVSLTLKTEDFSAEYLSNKEKTEIKIGEGKNGAALNYDKKDHSYSISVQNIPILSGTYEEVEGKKESEVKLTFSSIALGINGSLNIKVEAVDSIKEKTFDNPLDTSKAENLMKFREEVEDNDLLMELFNMIDGYLSSSNSWDSLDGFDL